VRIILAILTIFLILGCEKTSYLPGKEPLPDTAAPKLTLYGNKNITIKLDEPFKEPGFSAIDENEGDLSNKVEINSTIDTTTPGVYKITYKVCDSANNCASDYRNVRVSAFAIAALGRLEDAKILIYEIKQDGSKELLFEEKSSKSYHLDSMGWFDLHTDSLKDDKLYLIKIENGKDWDINNNGIKDSSYQDNLGKIRAFGYGSDIKALKNNIKIGVVSELLYELSAKDFKYNFNYDNFKNILNNNSAKILNSNDYKDVLSFDNVSKEGLKEHLKAKFNDFSNLILQNKKLLLNYKSSIKSLSTIDFARYITINKNYSKAYIADGNRGLTIVDISNLQEPKIKENIYLNDGFARCVKLNSDETKAYIANSEGGFVEVDLNSKTKRVLDLNATVRFVELTSNEQKAILAIDSKGVAVVNLNSFSVEKIIDTPDIAYSLSLINNNLALVADNKTGIIALNLDTNETLDTFNTYGYARGITVNKDKTYGFISDGTKGLVIIDISDLNNLSYISRVDTPDFARFAILDKNETRAFVADSKANLQVIDISDINAPKIINSIDTPYRTYSVALNSNESIALLATGSNGVEIVNLNGLPNLSILASLKPQYRNYRIFLDNNIAYVSSGYAGVSVIDITNALNPTLKTTIDTSGFTLNLTKEQNYLYVADGYKGIVKIDISDINSPNIKLSKDTPGNANELKIIPNSNYLLLADDNKGVKLINKSDLETVATFSVQDKAKAIAITNDGKKAIVASKDDGVYILQIDGANLNKIAQIQTSNGAYGVTLNKAQTKAFVVNGDNLSIIDLNSNQIVNNIQLTDFAFNIALNSDESKAYVAASNSGIVIVDLNKNEVIGFIDTKDKARDIKIKDNLAFVADSNGGLIVIDLELFN
jgi:hypothetical protein